MRRAIYKGVNLKTPVEIAELVSGFHVLGKNIPSQVVGKDGKRIGWPGNEQGWIGLHTFVDDIITIVLQSGTEACAYTALMCFLQGIERTTEGTHGAPLTYEEVSD